MLGLDLGLAFQCALPRLPALPQGRMLMAIPDLTIDNLLIIFTMIDRCLLQHD